MGRVAHAAPGVGEAIDSITRISNTASFAGLQLLDGSLSYITSGIATSAVTNASIFSTQFGDASSVSVEVEVVSSAQTGTRDLYVRNADGSGSERLILQSQYDQSPKHL